MQVPKAKATKDRGVGIVAQLAKSLCHMPTINIKGPFPVPSKPICCKWPGMAVEDGPSTWTPATLMEFLGSGLVCFSLDCYWMNQ